MLRKFRTMLKNEKGFTLVEVVVVAVIVAVLAAVAIPSYFAYVRSARIDAAHTACEVIGVAVIQTHNRGIDIGANNWANLGITSPSDENWDYTFPGLTGAATLGTGYSITATGKKGDLSGISGTFYPKVSGSARWTGVLAP
jgi:type IV pilus assembly protein PilE